MNLKLCFTIYFCRFFLKEKEIHQYLRRWLKLIHIPWGDSGFVSLCTSGSAGVSVACSVGVSPCPFSAGGVTAFSCVGSSAGAGVGAFS